MPIAQAMTAATSELEAATRLAIAALIGAGVGLEREWSGQTTGPNARFAGLRTFLLLGLSGGLAGLLVGAASYVAGTIIIAGCMAFTVAAYVMAARRQTGDIGGTTEAAALTVIALGALAGGGSLGLAAGAGSLVVLVLSEKARLHWLVRHVGELELHATLQFAVLALVVLPVLPDGPIGGALGVRPHDLWVLVLLFSGLNFAAYLLRKVLGSRAGDFIAGLVGGLVSSTAVTVNFARRSRSEPGRGTALAFGTIGACTVLIPRVIGVSALFSQSVALALARILWLPMVVGAAATVLGWRIRRSGAVDADVTDVQNPLRLRAAIPMAVAFQVALTVIGAVRERWGATGVYATASVLGLTDVDALTMSMSRLDRGLSTDLAARAITIGILANTGLKLVVGASLGGTAFRRVAVPGLVGLGVATGIALVVAWQ